ncbi:MAG: hypothetical protein ABW034_04390 [Steroidobacteraceae bacterium]
MSNTTGSFKYLNPFSPPGKAPDPYMPRLDVSRRGLRISLLSNMFTDATAFLTDLEEPLRPLLPTDATFRLFDKVHRRHTSYPLNETRVAEIAAESDALITAFGHCGSCTAGTVRDTVAFARAGVPVVALVTQKFMDEANFVARAAGIPTVPFVFLPHPTAGRDLPFQRALARAIAPLIVTALTQGKTQFAMDILAQQPLHAEVA